MRHTKAGILLNTGWGWSMLNSINLHLTKPKMLKTTELYFQLSQNNPEHIIRVKFNHQSTKLSQIMKEKSFIIKSQRNWDWLTKLIRWANINLTSQELYCSNQIQCCQTPAFKWVIQSNFVSKIVISWKLKCPICHVKQGAHYIIYFN